jgi:hypothetical protein
LDLASQLSDYIQLLLLSFFYLLPPLCWYLSSFFYSLSYRNQETPFIFWGVSQPEKITNYIFFWECFLDGLHFKFSPCMMYFSMLLFKSPNIRLACGSEK